MLSWTFVSTPPCDLLPERAWDKPARDFGRMMKRTLRHLVAALGLAASCVSAPAETLKLAVGIPGNWDTCIPDVGQRAGIFRRHGLDLEIVYTNGGGETLQATISGSVDIGIAAA